MLALQMCLLRTIVFYVFLRFDNFQNVTKTFHLPSQTFLKLFSKIGSSITPALNKSLIRSPEAEGGGKQIRQAT